MKRMLVFAAFLTIGACGGGDPAVKLANSSPAAGATLKQYSDSITDRVRLDVNADLAQRFCKNLLSTPCPSDLVAKLEAYGFRGEGTGVELAAAFSNMEADILDGQTDQKSDPETFMRAAYKVILGREPDQEGAKVNLRFIKESGERNQLLRAMLQSPEFKSLS